MKRLQNNRLKIDYDNNRNGIKRITLNADQHQLNWVKSNSGLFGELFGEYTKVSHKYEPNCLTSTYYYNELEVVVKLYIEDNVAYLDYVFTNKQTQPLSFNTGDIGIFAPFNDSYTTFTKEHQLAKKCHAHIWCGESSSYIYALRMSGDENNFGIQLVGGQIADYLVLRKMQANDRGDFVLLFRPFTINPMDKLHIRLKMFTFRNEKRFFEKVLKEESYLKIDVDKFTYRVNEEIKVELTGKNIKSITVMCDNTPIEEVKLEDDKYLVCGSFSKAGIKKFTVKYNNHTTHFDINVIENELQLIDKRLKFIIDNQQNTDKNDSKCGAYYLYDFNLNKKVYEVSASSDRNLGKDRVGMAVSILARLLSKFEIDETFKNELDKSIKLYMDFVDRAIVKDNGVVTSTAFYKSSIKENHNAYGWYSLLYTLMYEYTGDKKYYDKAVKIVNKFYEHGGSNAYVQELPILKLIDIANSFNDTLVAESLKAKYTVHIENILKHGIHFPTDTVRFSDTVVASATDTMLDAYEMTKNEMYLIEAKKLFKILLSFSGKQPSVYMNDATITHWQGYKYGESKLFGDNFPSCSSAITAKVLSRYSNYKNKPIYQTRANNILFNTLLLYNNDKASCCYIFPYKINSFMGKKFDMLSNNQDWIIYYNLVYNNEFNKAYKTINDVDKKKLNEIINNNEN